MKLLIIYMLEENLATLKNIIIYYINIYNI